MTTIHTQQDTSIALYIADNEKLWRLIENLPPGLEGDADYVIFLLHSISVKRWLDDLDDWGWARLKAEILRQYIPTRKLKPIKNFLFNAGVLKLAPYKPKVRCTGYKISREFDGPPMRVIPTNAGLIRKRLAWRQGFGRTDVPALVQVIQQRYPVLEQMRATLNRITLVDTVKNVVRMLRGCSVDTGHVQLVCSMICNDDHDGIIVDKFGFRVHNIITRTASVIRPFLRLDGQGLTEVDVANAQPLLLAAALRRPDICTSYVRDAHHIGRAWPVPRGWCSLVASSEVERFSLLCEDGLLYEFLQAEGGFPDRDNAKHLLYRDVLFCEPHIRNTMTKVFERSFPGLFEAMVQLKRSHGYKAISMLLQRLESHIMIDCVCQRLVGEHPGLSFLTIHDSALVVASQGETVRNLIGEEFAKYGVRASFKPTQCDRNQKTTGNDPREGQ